MRSLQAEPDAKRWTLVLPRWNARHWQDKQAGLPWSAFFELVPLREYVAPVGVVEFDEFAAYRAGCNRAATVDRVLHLVRDIPDDWSKPHPKFTAVDCSADSEQLYSTPSGSSWWKLAIFGEVPLIIPRTGLPLWSRDLECVKTFGKSTAFRKQIALRVRSDSAQAILIGRFEQLTHHFVESDSEFWRQLNSLQFAEVLVTEAAHFRQQIANEMGQMDDGTGGSTAPLVLAAHLRRGDFVGEYFSWYWYTLVAFNVPEYTETWFKVGIHTQFFVLRRSAPHHAGCQPRGGG